MQPTQNATDLTDEQLLAHYNYPAYPDADAPWFRVNFVASIDGAVTIAGTSGGLGTPIDGRIFHLLRELADAVLVGAGTARAENYGRADIDARGIARRLASGRSAEPVIVVVSARADLDPKSRLLTDSGVAPMVITGTGADPDRRAALAAAGATVLTPGTGSVTTAAIRATLAAHGLRRVLCEGGPHLVGQLLADGCVDEVCLTTSPIVVGGSDGRFAVSPAATPTPMTRALLLGDADGTVLTRWVRPSPF